MPERDTAAADTRPPATLAAQSANARREEHGAKRQKQASRQKDGLLWVIVLGCGEPRIFRAADLATCSARLQQQLEFERETCIVPNATATAAVLTIGPDAPQLPPGPIEEAAWAALRTAPDSEAEAALPPFPPLTKEQQQTQLMWWSYFTAGVRDMPPSLLAAVADTEEAALKALLDAGTFPPTFAPQARRDTALAILGTATFCEDLTQTEQRRVLAAMLRDEAVFGRECPSVGGLPVQPDRDKRDDHNDGFPLLFELGTAAAPRVVQDSFLTRLQRVLSNPQAVRLAVLQRIEGVGTRNAAAVLARFPAHAVFAGNRFLAATLAALRDALQWENTGITSCDNPGDPVITPATPLWLLNITPAEALHAFTLDHGGGRGGNGNVGGDPVVELLPPFVRLTGCGLASCPLILVPPANMKYLSVASAECAEYSIAAMQRLPFGPPATHELVAHFNVVFPVQPVPLDKTRQPEPPHPAAGWRTSEHTLLRALCQGPPIAAEPALPTRGWSLAGPRDGLLNSLLGRRLQSSWQPCHLHCLAAAAHAAGLELLLDIAPVHIRASSVYVTCGGGVTFQPPFPPRRGSGTAAGATTAAFPDGTAGLEPRDRAAILDLEARCLRYVQTQLARECVLYCGVGFLAALESRCSMADSILNCSIEFAEVGEMLLFPVLCRTRRTVFLAAWRLPTKNLIDDVNDAYGPIVRDVPRILRSKMHVPSVLGVPLPQE